MTTKDSAAGLLRADDLRERLRAVSKDESGTWGLVAIFMDMIDDSEAAYLAQGDGWIKCSERLPEQRALCPDCAALGKPYKTGTIVNGEKIVTVCDNCGGTGYTPLPPLPADDKGE